MHIRLHPLARLTALAAVALVLPACEVNLNTEGVTVREKRTFAGFAERPGAALRLEP